MRAAALLCGSLLASVAMGCEEYGPRVYTGRPVVAGLGCLPASVPLGVVQAGDLPADCEARCLLIDAALYVSPVCPPLPARALELGPDQSPACARALWLFDNQAFCGALDAGPSAAGGFDARLDASPFGTDPLGTVRLGEAREAP